MLKSKYGKPKLLAVLLAGLMLCTACGMGENLMSEQNWSENELALMEYLEVEKERMDSGKLLPGEQKVLAALAQAELFLMERYPGETMTFVKVDNASGVAVTHSFTVFSSVEPEDIFVVKVTAPKEDGGETAIHETRFNTVMLPQLQTLVQATVDEMQVEAVARVRFVGMYGAEHDPLQPLTELLSSGLLVDVAGEILVEESQLTDAFEKQLGPALRAKGLCSGVTLLVVQDDCLKKAVELPLLENPYVVRRIAVRLPANQAAEVN